MHNTQNVEVNKIVVLALQAALARAYEEVNRVKAAIVATAPFKEDDILVNSVGDKVKIIAIVFLEGETGAVRWKAQKYSKNDTPTKFHIMIAPFELPEWQLWSNHTLSIAATSTSIASDTDI